MRLAASVALLSLLGCGGRDAASAPAASRNPASEPVEARAAQSTPDDGEWRIPAKDYASTRYSSLNQITPANLAQLQPAFTFSTGVLRVGPPLTRFADRAYIAGQLSNDPQI